MKISGFLFIIFLFFSSILIAQDKFSISLRNGTIRPEANFRQGFIDTFNRKIVRVNNKAYVVLQFEQTPTEAIKNILNANGIKLLDYVSGNAYTATIAGDLKIAGLSQAFLRSIVELRAQQKMQAALAGGYIPSYAVKANGTVDVWISFPSTFSANEVQEQLQALNIEILPFPYQDYRILALRIATNRLNELASLPFIEYVQPAPAGDQPLNFNSRTGSRARLLNASVADGGKGLNGEGIVVGIGDNADIQTHIDFSGRLINRAAVGANGHGHHVSGILAGAGNILELYRGYAPKATIVSQKFSGIIENAATYVRDYGMVITNNSYGDILECTYHGTYDLTSRLLDQMAFDLPALENVFASGNSGASTCPPFAAGYRTVLGGYQSAKNVLTVGATTDLGAIAGFSSRGPVKDGRTKPEVVAMGQSVFSDWPTNGYSYNNGTSMAAPAVSGGLALLYQRYRQLHGGANPQNGLMKALICNGAADKGNTGPDYQYGFGWLNVLRSMEMLENNRYLTGLSKNGVVNTHNISVPNGIAQLKILLYWNDPAASPLNSQTLVNDLDLQVHTPSLSTVLPLVLDTTVANVGNTATNGVDHINNIEQVVIDNPAAGDYAINIIGTAINQNPAQEYFVVYDMIPVQLKITAPVGGDGLVPGEQTKIAWEADGFSSGTATLEYSPDNGISWNSIATGVDVNSKIYSWVVPAVQSDKVLVRITKEGSGETSVTHPFVILSQPIISLAPQQCEGYINMNWTVAGGATDYEVMMLRGDEMKTVALTSSTNYTLSGLSKDSIYWVTVRARINSKAGRRAMAIARQPNSGTCSGTISDRDLKVDAILSPVSGRKFTSTALTATTAITVRIKNLDDAPVNNFDVKYSVNNGPWITENVNTPIAAGAIYTHSFATMTDLSATGNYNLVVVVKNTAGDPVTSNDTLTTLIKQLDNAPLNLAGFFVDDLESAVINEYKKDSVIGIPGIDRYDFKPLTPFGRMRPFINTGIAWSGSRAITLDVDRIYATGNVNYLYGTFNLRNYNAALNDLRLDFQFLKHGQENNANNKVWIRGDDSKGWIEICDLNLQQNEPGVYKKTESLKLSDTLLAAAQNFGSSFQIRWGQYGSAPAVDKESASGYSFDDIRLYEVFNDLEIKSIDAPFTASCGLSNATVIKTTIRNNSNNSIASVPIRYRINNDLWISENISIAAKATMSYSFNTPADLSGFNQYIIQTVIDFNGDSFRDNDTATIVVNNAPMITTFPYLQNFEANNGYWFSGGKNSTWEYGTPASPHMNRAASGAKAWKTKLQGHYNDDELSYLYSPCFNISGMTNPALSFSMALDVEDCGILCDGVWMEYSTDGIVWTKLGSAGSGTNWYNKGTDQQLWSDQNYYYWHVATTPLPIGLNNLRLRFVFRSDQGVNREGVAIDDIHVYDNTQGIYDGQTLSVPVIQNVAGNGWQHFTSSGKLVASILPGNQDLGSTAVQVYIFPDSVRNANNQYYHNRNITIRPAFSNLTDSVLVRFYFLDSETDSLIKAHGCAACTRPTTAYELGVSEYSDPNASFENGTLLDNRQGTWRFIQPENVVKVPFDKGYYAEFKVKNFSEFWLNNGGFAHNTPLPVKLMDFTAQRVNDNTVLLKWQVGGEIDVDRYEIEVARGNEAFQRGLFIKIGEVVSQGNTTVTRTYNFTDNDENKYGSQYYRIKISNADGSFTYSSIQAVVFDEFALWNVYPNPSIGKFYLTFQLNSTQKLGMQLYDVTGRLVKENQIQAKGFPQKVTIDLGANYASGIYLLKVTGGSKEAFFKLQKL